MADVKLTQIAHQFNLKGIGAASYATHQIRQSIKEDGKFKQQVEELINHIQQHRL